MNNKKITKKITIEEMVSEIKRELKMRKDVFPRQIRNGKLDRNVANYQYLCMEAAMHKLIEIDQQNKGSQAELFNQSKPQ